MEHPNETKTPNTGDIPSKDGITGEYLPIYRGTSLYARQTGELDLYRTSLRENCACREAIEKAIRENFDGWDLNAAGARAVLKQFGSERVNYVLANTVQIADWDARYSSDNRRWAEAIPVTDSPRDTSSSRYSFVIRSHPYVLNGFISQVRKAERERPSLLEAIQKPVEKTPKARPAKSAREEAR